MMRAQGYTTALNHRKDFLVILYPKKELSTHCQE